MNMQFFLNQELTGTDGPCHRSMKTLPSLQCQHGLLQQGPVKGFHLNPFILLTHKLSSDQTHTAGVGAV